MRVVSHTSANVQIHVSLKRCFKAGAISFISVAEVNADGSCGDCIKKENIAAHAGFYEFTVPVGTCNKQLCVYVHDGKYRRFAPMRPFVILKISTSTRSVQCDRWLMHVWAGQPGSGKHDRLLTDCAIDSADLQGDGGDRPLRERLYLISEPEMPAVRLREDRCAFTPSHLPFC